MTEELDIQKHDLKSIQKLYSTVCSQNTFLNQYTLLDVEEGKKKVYHSLLKKHNYQKDKDIMIQQFVDASAKQLTDALFVNHSGESRNTQMVGVKNVIQDPRKLNPTYFQETHRVIYIDSAYRSNLWHANYVYDSKTSTNMNVELNDTLSNVTSLELTNVNIPYTFYTIDTAYGNNYFYVQKVSDDDTLEKIEISGGNYTSSTLITAINYAFAASTNFQAISATLNTVTNKVSIENNNPSDNCLFVFYDYLDDAQSFADTMSSALSPNTQTRINNNLGWILGFRTIDNSNVCLEYTINAGETLQAESLCFIPQTKYFILVIDDMNKNQSNKGLVQISNHDKDFIKPTHYFKETDNSLNCLTDANCASYVDDTGRTMTKNQIYSALQINNYRSDLTKKNANLNTNLIDNVFGIVPFENKSLVWGQSMFMSDKNRYKRKYAGPVSIEKLKIRLLNDRGNLVNLNGAEWSFSMISTHLYQT